MSSAQTMILGSALALCLLSSWFALYLVAMSAFVESHSQTVLYNSFRENLSSATVPLDGAIDPGTAVALIDFPAVGVDNLVVVEGTTSTDLMAGPGHRSDTVLPGQAGVSVIYGRGMAYGGPFHGLVTAQRGMTFVVTTGQGVFHYRVTDLRRTGDPLPVALTPGSSRMTLVSTQSGTGALSRFAPTDVVYVDAELVGKAQPSGSHPLAASQPEQVMQGDPSALPMVMIWLQALLLAVGAGIWAWYRWGRPQTWIAAGGVGLAALWMLSSAVAALLPNLL